MLLRARRFFASGRYIEGKKLCEKIAASHPGTDAAKKAAAHVASGGILRVEKVVDNGPSENRFDVVFVAEGYTNINENKEDTNGDGVINRNEQALFAGDVDASIKEFLKESPFREYGDYINFWRVNVTSLHAGADKPFAGIPVFRDTPFGASHSRKDTPRLLTVDFKHVLEKISTDIESDQVFVLVNGEWGGSGTKGVIVVGINRYKEKDADKEWSYRYSMRTVLHEFGHSCGLADEYDDEGDEGLAVVKGEPPFPNVTRKIRPGKIKWQHWIETGTEIPTRGVGGRVGAYEGAYYQRKGCYRPQYRCCMRRNQYPFCAVCRETILKHIYKHVKLVESFSPEEKEITLSAGEPRTFSITTPGKSGKHALEIKWLLNGRPLGQSRGRSVTLRADGLAVGRHTLEVVVRDKTPLVRHDPDKLLSGRHSWVIVRKEQKQ
jgi:hypothetical protein